ncbi:MAG: ABC transporter ATP-binding protein [Armatimonadota bacterium]|nr:ABC transporter ATP-binding protein [Armatimonadota bacterium]MDR7548312.1 ABC transporter ATP-binding protein [Armatimonadota bacterium]
MGPLLQTEALHKAFGGLQAVQGVDLRVDPGEIRAIIGPNGAGKTTLVGMISGRVRPTSGRVLFDGRDITAAPAHARVALGIVSTFQLTNIYGNLSVYANVALAVQRRRLRSAFDILRPDDPLLAGEVQSALEEVGLPTAWDLPAGVLPHGHQRLLEMAMALALRPQLLILDEPTQGLDPDESAALTALIRRIADRVTVLLVEHNLEVVLGLSHRITVMDRGSIIAEGTPGEIEANPDVQRVYLGQ